MHVQPSKLSALSSQSPFAQMAQQDQKKSDAAGQPKKPGFLGRLCACGREPEAQEEEDRSVGQPLEEKSRSNSVGSGRVVLCPLHACGFSVAQTEAQKDAAPSIAGCCTLLRAGLGKGSTKHGIAGLPVLSCLLPYMPACCLWLGQRLRSRSRMSAEHLSV